MQEDHGGRAQIDLAMNQDLLFSRAYEGFRDRDEVACRLCAAWARGWTKLATALCTEEHESPVDGDAHLHGEGHEPGGYRG